ncbi:MAG: hypothetical protein COA57_00425 [Flavobacteriales bacterium]|nr:hypothetical protein [Bacteroidales bacterium AH-315-I05]PCJ90050.1 MAG: hypothetical protein COA57_00425 [Flavobacteriales bacterium]
MKATLNLTTKLILAVFLTCVMGVEKTYSFDLIITGKVTLNGRTLEGATVELYQEDKLIKKVNTKKLAKYRFKLNLDLEYTIVVSYPKCFAKRIKFYTSVPESGIADHVFYLNVDLFKVYIIPEDFFINEPVATIEYSTNSETFDIEWSYTATKQVEIFQLRKMQLLHKYYGMDNTANELNEEQLYTEAYPKAISKTNHAYTL